MNIHTNTFAVWVNAMETENNHPQRTPGQVLVVDDDEFTLEIIKRILESQGVDRVITCESGQEGLDAINAAPGAIDALILDLNMPEMDGIEFIQHLDADKFTGNLILSSGEDAKTMADVEGRVLARNIHSLGYLKKPITRSALINILGLPG